MDAPHPGAEHLIVLPARDLAETVAKDLREEGFEQVRVVESVAAADAGRVRARGGGEPWAVHVVDTRLPDAAGGGAYEGLRERFTDLAREQDGWYEAPGDPRGPA